MGLLVALGLIAIGYKYGRVTWRAVFLIFGAQTVLHLLTYFRLIGASAPAPSQFAAAIGGIAIMGTIWLAAYAFGALIKRFAARRSS
jgi:hypothetical protein